MNQLENNQTYAKQNVGTFHHFQDKSRLTNCNTLNINEIWQHCKNTVQSQSRFSMRECGNNQYKFECTKCQNQCKIRQFTIKSHQLSLKYLLKEIECIYYTYKALKQFNIHACNAKNSLYHSICCFCKTQTITIIDFGSKDVKDQSKKRNFNDKKPITKIIRVFIDSIKQFIDSSRQGNRQIANEILEILTKIEANSSLFYYYLNVMLNQQSQMIQSSENKENSKKEQNMQFQLKKVQLKENSPLKQQFQHKGEYNSLQLFEEKQKKVVEFRSHAFNQLRDDNQSQVGFDQNNCKLHERSHTTKHKHHRRKKVMQNRQNIKSPHQIASSTIQSINQYIQQKINKIGQDLNEIAVLMHKYGISFQFSMFLIYKESFYLRAQLSLILEEGQFEEFTNQLDWQQIKNNPLINPLMADTISQIVKDNKMIFQSLQIMLSKLKLTQKWNSIRNRQFYQIMIEEKEYISEKYIKELINQTVPFFHILKQKIDQKIENQDQKYKEIATLYRFGCLIYKICKRYLKEDEIQPMYKYSVLKSQFAMKHEINEMAVDLRTLLSKSQ